tara:strand:+ start:479 stop:706 length:228 start_codon:yes stop_codon:yes gene_type:complete
MENITNLDDLLTYIKSNIVDDRDMCNLPSFGGEAPSDTTEIWSWDEERLIIGSCQDEYEIVTREFMFPTESDRIR